jgi:dTMP kinase
MSAPQKGLFISLEGGEGAGKTTAMAQISAWLTARGRSVVTTREPGGTELAERIRTILLDSPVGSVSEITELLLMFASRAQHVDEVIRPALARGQVVLCDRFTDASLAYQGGGRELGLDLVRKVADIVHPNLWPDLTLLLDVPVELGLKRVGQRNQAMNRFELEKTAFLERVRQTYLQLAEAEPGRFWVIDASQSHQSVKREIQKGLEARLG